MKYGLMGIIYCYEFKEKESFDYFLKDIIGLFSKYGQNNWTIEFTYKPIQKTSYVGIEDSESYKERVTMDWGVEIVNDLKKLNKKKKRSRHRKEKNENK